MKYKGNWTSHYKSSSMSKGHKGPQDSDLLVQLFNDEAYSVKVFQQIFKYIRTLIHTEQDAYEHKVS